MRFSATPVLEYSYLVEILNAEHKSKFVTKIWHNVHDKFNCPQALKDKLYETFEDKLPSATALEIDTLIGEVVQSSG